MSEFRCMKFNYVAIDSCERMSVCEPSCVQDNKCVCVNKSESKE